jgi:hypothetical protein
MKIKYYILAATVLAALVVVGADKPFALPLAKLTVQVVDEQHVPIQGVHVNLTFMDPVTRKGVPIGGLTDASGFFTGEGGSDSSIGGTVQKDGYYSGGFPFEPFRDAKDGRWQPWDPTYVSVLRKIEKPMAMYGKRAWIEIPQTNVPCGYDLEAGDWVAPYGNGKTSDFIITLKREYENRRKFNVSVAISFSNPLDGIQETKLPEDYRYSDFKWPRSAPDTGYEATFTTRLEVIPGKGYNDTASEKQAYFFRVRTVERDGKIVSALYGKIGGGLRLAPSNSKTCELYLAYYLNPTPLDRNMEFDLKHNLLTNIGQFEDLREP